MNRAQTNHVLKRWKLYENYKSQLNAFELKDYERILKWLELLNDKELQFIYIRYNVMATIQERCKLNNSPNKRVLSKYRTELASKAEFLAAMNMTGTEYFKMLHKILDKCIAYEAENPTENENCNYTIRYGHHLGTRA